MVGIVHHLECIAHQASKNEAANVVTANVADPRGAGINHAQPRSMEGTQRPPGQFTASGVSPHAPVPRSLKRAPLGSTTVASRP